MKSLTPLQMKLLVFNVTHNSRGLTSARGRVQSARGQVITLYKMIKLSIRMAVPYFFDIIKELVNKRLPTILRSYLTLPTRSDAAES